MQSIKQPGLYKGYDQDLLITIASLEANAIETAQTLLHTQQQLNLKYFLIQLANKLKSQQRLKALLVALREIG